MAALTGFVAYPADPPFLGETIERAIGLAGRRFGAGDIRSWRELDIPGRFIATELLGELGEADFLVADISTPNFNVTYEVGYAIGRGKRVIPILNPAIQGAQSAVNSVGLFDTLGYRTYGTAVDLADILKDLKDTTPLNILFSSNLSAPVYLNQAKHRTDWETRIISRVKKARLFFRSFDPAEQPRLSASEAIRQVAQSYGVLVHLLPASIDDSLRHNLRAAFLAGLAEGMDKALVVIQSGDTPVPVDYRDLVEVCLHPTQYDDAIAEFATQVTEAMQAQYVPQAKAPTGVLDRLNLGASSAENELTVLGAYYMQTDAFRRAQRKEVRIVSGRKGSGKSAVFFQLRDSVRRNKSNVVVDLKPDGYQLLKFKDSVLKLMAAGTLEHTITAFWEYLLLLEICYKLLEKDHDVHKRDHRLFKPYQRLSASYRGDEYVSEGDFSERMSRLLRKIKDEFEARYGGQASLTLSQAQITDLLYKHDVGRLRADVQAYLSFKDELWLLFDNLDKGWPARGLQLEDLVIIRTLIEATRKIERELVRKDIEAHTVVFLRNDVYELLVEETPDRGKEARANVDWTDPDLLRELLRKRMVYGGLDPKGSFEQLWRSICTSIVDGEESSQYLIDRCLMRPRCLLDLIIHCKGYAVNLGHERVQPEDIKKGIAAYATDLISEVALEIRDVFPQAEDILYAFVGCPRTVSHSDFLARLRSAGIDDESLPKVQDLLLWFGFVGLDRTDAFTKYIFTYNYDMKRFRAALKAIPEPNRCYQINEAFWAGLEIQ